MVLFFCHRLKDEKDFFCQEFHEFSLITGLKLIFVRLVLRNQKIKNLRKLVQFVVKLFLPKTVSNMGL